MTDLIKQRNWAHQFVGSIGVAKFESDIREHESKLFSSVLSRANVANLFDLAALQEILSNKDVPVSNADLFDGSHIVRLSDVLNKSGNTPYSTILNQLAKGATLRIRAVETLNKIVKQVVTDLTTTFSGAVTANLYLTPSKCDGFRAHFDNTDVFVLQLYGQKRWLLHDDYTNIQMLPLREMPWDPARYVPKGEGRLLVLTPGDVLYMPRGSMHEAACADYASMHLTFSLDPDTILDALTRELRIWAEQEVTLRYRANGKVPPHEICTIVRQFADRLEKASDSAVLGGNLSAATSRNIEAITAQQVSLEQFLSTQYQVT